MSKKPRPLPFSWIEKWREDPEIPSGVRLVLYALAAYMDKKGVAWPSVTTLARDTGYSRRHVFTHLSEAHRSGWLVIQNEKGPKGRGGRPNLYRAVTPEVVNPTSPPENESPRSGEIDTRSGEIYDTKVVNPTSTEYSGNAQERILTPTSDRSLRAQSAEGGEEGGSSKLLLTANIEDAIEGSDSWGLTFQAKAAGLGNIIQPEARWILMGARQATKLSIEMEEGTISAGGRLYTSELIAEALYDMGRKAPRRWSRKTFLGFLAQAIRVRTDVTGAGEWGNEEEVDFVYRCWPLEAQV